MAEINAFPVAEVRNWIQFEKELRSELADRGAEPELIDYVHEQIRIVYDKHGLGVPHSISVPEDSAPCIKQATDAARGFYEPAITGLLSEIIIREIYFYRLIGGAKGMHSAPDGSPPSIADVIEFPPRPTPPKVEST